MRRKVQELTISYPPPGPFSIDCPALIKKDAVFRGIPLWEFYFPAEQLDDFLKGLAIQAGIVQFNADKTIRTERQPNVEATALPVGVARAQSSECNAVKPKKQVQSFATHRACGGMHAR